MDVVVPPGQDAHHRAAKRAAQRHPQRGARQRSGRFGDDAVGLVEFTISAQPRPGYDTSSPEVAHGLVADAPDGRDGAPSTNVSIGCMCGSAWSSACPHLAAPRSAPRPSVLHLCLIQVSSRASRRRRWTYQPFDGAPQRSTTSTRPSPAVHDRGIVERVYVGATGRSQSRDGDVSSAKPSPPRRAHQAVANARCGPASGASSRPAVDASGIPSRRQVTLPLPWFPAAQHHARARWAASARDQV